MSILDNKRLTNEIFKLDIERMRRGWYSDKYFENIGRMLSTLASEDIHTQVNITTCLQGYPLMISRWVISKWRCNGSRAVLGIPSW